MTRAVFALASAFALMASPALAHTGFGPASGFVSGFGHPIGGLDHILAMVAVGVLAVQLGGRSVWLIPSTFVGMMVLGGVLGVAGVAMPFVEQGVAGSVVILGVVVAVGRKLPVATAMTLVGALALFHGHAHGTEMPMNAVGVAYGAGFALATGLLHAFGIGLAVVAKKTAEKIAPVVLRLGGAAIAAAGLTLTVS